MVVSGEDAGRPAVAAADGDSGILFPFFILWVSSMGPAAGLVFFIFMKLFAMHVIWRTAKTPSVCL
jgi:hypothetical protein